jgi:hypothetical protein
MPRVTRLLPIANISSRQIEKPFVGFIDGINTYAIDEEVKDTQLRLAQDARITNLGAYKTRQGADHYSSAAGQALDTQLTSTTGASSATFGTISWLAQKFVPGTTGRLVRVDLNLKNSNSATGTVLVKIYSDSGGSPGSELASSSIATTDITSTYQYLTARFIKTPQVTNGSTYWIVCYIQDGGTNSYSWSSTTSATTAKTSANAGTSWSTTSYALNYKTYVATDSPCLGVYRAYKSNGTKATLFAHGTSVYSVSDTDGSLTAIKTGLNAAATKYRFAKANDVVYYVNGVDSNQKWDFTTAAVTGGSPAIASNIIEHKGVMFYQDASDPNKYFWSNFGVYETFTSTDFNYVPSPKTGDPLVAWEKLNDTLVMITRHNKFQLYGSNNATWQLVQSTGRKGTYSQESIATDTNYIYFAADDGIYRFNGTQDELISGPIYQDYLNISSKEKIVLNVNQGRLRVYYPDTGSAVNNKCYVYNIALSKWESQDTDTYVSFAYSMYDDSNKLLIGSSYVGAVYYQEQTSNDYTNLGAPINYELRTHYYNFGFPGQEKEIRTWKPRFTAQSGAYSVTCQYAYNKRDTANLAPNGTVNVQGSGSAWGTAIWGAFTWGREAFIEPNLNVPGQYSYIQLRYKHYAARQPVEFFGHTLIVQVRKMK